MTASPAELSSGKLCLKTAFAFLLLAATAVPSPSLAQTSTAVDSSSLADVDPDSIGLLSPADGGLGYDMWDGAPRALIDRLLPEMQLPTASPSLNSLARKLLLSMAGIPAPASAKDAPKRSLTAARVERLLALGDVSGAWDLAQLAKPDRLDEITLRLVAEAALVSPKAEDACRKLKDLMSGRSSIEWQKSLMLCQLKAGDQNSATLGLDLLREQKADDDAFAGIFSRNVLGGEKKLPSQLTPMRPVTLALLRHIDAALPSELYVRPAAMLMPDLLKAKTTDADAHLILAERAAAMALIDEKRLAEIYAAASFTPEALAGATTASEPSPKLRAMLYQLAKAEPDALKRSATISRLAQMTDAASLSGAAGRLLADLVGEIPPTSDFNSFSGAAARVLAVSGRAEKAKEWLALAQGPAGRLPEVAAQVHEIWPLAAIAGALSDAGYGAGIGTWIEKDLKNSDRESRQRTGAVLLLLSASGYAVPDDAWAKVADTVPDGAKIPSFSPVIFNLLRESAAHGRKGETALLAITLAAGQSAGKKPKAEGMPLLVAVDLIKALRQAGLQAHSKGLALETMASLVFAARRQDQ